MSAGDAQADAGGLCEREPRHDARLRPRRPRGHRSGRRAHSGSAQGRIARHGEADLPAGGGGRARRVCHRGKRLARRRGRAAGLAHRADGAEGRRRRDGGHMGQSGDDEIRRGLHRARGACGRLPGAGDKTRCWRRPPPRWRCTPFRATAAGRASSTWAHCARARGETSCRITR